MQPSEEIKSRLDIVDVIRDYIQLQAAGGNFRARCPFHQEKSPSFMVSPEKQIFHCFGCSKGGDVFSFVQEIEGITFIEALRLLAPKAGVTLKQEDPKTYSKRNRILDILDISRKYYHKVLMDSKAAEKARDYLEKRGLTEDTIEEWQVGYSQDSWDDLINILKERGFKDEEIFASGMSVKKEETGRYYNRFRGRIMFPINDVNANTVAFTARVSPEKEATEKMGKYINSPQTDVYDKSKVLFGLDKAKVTVKNQDYAILVEGQMDVITAHQNGFRNVVASSGTALTKEQLNLLKRFSNNIALAFDMDKAGIMAADRGIRETLREGMNIKIIEVPNGKDPDECIKNDLDGWVGALKNAKQMMQYYFDQTFTGLNISKIENIKKAQEKLLPIIAILPNKIERDFWISKFSQITNSDESVVREELSKILKNSEGNQYQDRNQVEVRKLENVSRTREDQLSQLLLSFAFKFPYLFEYLINNLPIEHLSGQENKAIYKKLIFYYNNNINNQETSSEFEYFEFRNWLLSDKEAKNQIEIENQLKLAEKLVLLIDKEFTGLDDENAKEGLIGMLKDLKAIHRKNKMKEIERMIVQLEANTDIDSEDEINGLMNELKYLSEN
ncbi:DNA primase [Candidatus Parcubacteria bacterium]|nr:DNA primase [Patescibacteria group bacterium]MBU4309122.1 DNA primase [Patescibacteria group bacterium]MBU4432718.1 DNA primase [Patescibacteria group bacterium]MBU4577483.1 DNA primase [Patescibacteria group bacterium]MCG2697171.1 DNA primase [Candidatus Parcubacteria bacterium]